VARPRVRRRAVPTARAARIARDPWARALGVRFLALAPGRCRVALTLRPHMQNAYGQPHGGVLFSVADVALGAACNTHGGPPALALSMAISFLAAAPPGARLIAEARARRQGRRAGFYDVTVTTAGGVAVAALQAVVYRVDASPGENRSQRRGQK
jgi:acyl-CoA thioesterase